MYTSQKAKRITLKAGHRARQARNRRHQMRQMASKGNTVIVNPFALEDVTRYNIPQEVLKRVMGDAMAMIARGEL